MHSTGTPDAMYFAMLSIGGRCGGLLAWGDGVAGFGAHFGAAGVLAGRGVAVSAAGPSPVSAWCGGVGGAFGVGGAVAFKAGLVCSPRSPVLSSFHCCLIARR